MRSFESAGPKNAGKQKIQASNNVKDERSAKTF
jgi:hypothetical protein